MEIPSSVDAFFAGSILFDQLPWGTQRAILLSLAVEDRSYPQGETFTGGNFDGTTYHPPSWHTDAQPLPGQTWPWGSHRG